MRRGNTGGVGALIDLLVPPACAACGRFGAALCEPCLAGFRPAGREDEAFIAPDPGAVAGERLTLALAAFAYDGPLRAALQRLKYAGASRVAQALADAALPAFDRLLMLAGPLPLIPVPVHPERRRERGYNQAGLLAHRLATATSLEVREILLRARSTEKQHRLDRAGRLRNLAEAFSVRSGDRAPPGVIVVDDILTTSATMEASAGVLRAAGCAEVYGFAIAREV